MKGRVSVAQNSSILQRNSKFPKPQALSNPSPPCHTIEQIFDSDSKTPSSSPPLHQTASPKTASSTSNSVRNRTFAKTPPPILIPSSWLQPHEINIHLLSIFQIQPRKPPLPLPKCIETLKSPLSIFNTKTNRQGGITRHHFPIPYLLHVASRSFKDASNFHLYEIRGSHKIAGVWLVPRISLTCRIVKFQWPAEVGDGLRKRKGFPGGRTGETGGLSNSGSDKRRCHGVTSDRVSQ
jgi:hypothetical protein